MDLCHLWGYKATQISSKHKKTKFNSPNSCFYNAHSFVLKNKNSKYVLGYILYKGIPIEHAFVKIGNEYYDLTLETVKSQEYKLEYFVCIEIPYNILIKLNIPIGELDLYQSHKLKLKT